MTEAEENSSYKDVTSKIESARKKFSVPSNFRRQSHGSVVLRVPSVLCDDLGIASLGKEGNPNSLDAWTQIQEGRYGKYIAFWIPVLQKNPKRQGELEKNPDIYQTTVSGYDDRSSRLFFVPRELQKELGVEEIYHGNKKSIDARLRVEYNQHGYYLVAWLPYKQFNSKISPFQPFRTADDLNEEGKVIENV